MNAMAPFLLIKHLSPLLYKGKSQKQVGDLLLFHVTLHMLTASHDLVVLRAGFAAWFRGECVVYGGQVHEVQGLDALPHQHGQGGPFYSN